jgi:16S rRNA C1402 N4-methylase RsmH
MRHASQRVRDDPAVRRAAEKLRPRIHCCRRVYSFRLILAETKKLKKSLQNMYTRNFLRGILSSIAFASVRDRVCALLRNILENY